MVLAVMNNPFVLLRLRQFAACVKPEPHVILDEIARLGSEPRIHRRIMVDAPHDGLPEIAVEICRVAARNRIVGIEVDDQLVGLLNVLVEVEARQRVGEHPRGVVGIADARVGAVDVCLDHLGQAVINQFGQSNGRGRGRHRLRGGGCIAEHIAHCDRIAVLRVRGQPSVGIARRSLPTAARAPRIAAGLIKAILNPAGRIAACCRHRDFGVADRDRLAGEFSRIRSRRIEIQRSRRPQCCHGRLQIIDREQRLVAGDRPDRLMPRIQLIRLCLTATSNLQHAAI